MSLSTQVKKEIIGQYRVHKTDVGSPEVQIAILSRRIADLTEHLKQHRKDFSTRRGLLALVRRRRRLLSYLRDNDPERYKSIVSQIGLRG